PPTTKTLNTKQILAALLAVLAPNGKGAKIANVRKHGSYVLSFNAPAAGELTIGWYELPKGAHLSAAKHAKPKPILVAGAHVTVTKAGKVKVTVKLNAKGKALLRHSKRVKLTAKGTFKIKGRPLATATKAFFLK
ncbi:MAG TPA: hypothetical protein VH025_00005, partial [Solirubrobacteraceae bacterium]|nr:hypothetical protein [Solirubrobacteraceae bacterium]